MTGSITLIECTRCHEKKHFERFYKKDHVARFPICKQCQYKLQIRSINRHAPYKLSTEKKQIEESIQDLEHEIIMLAKQKVDINDLVKHETRIEVLISEMHTKTLQYLTY